MTDREQETQRTESSRGPRTESHRGSRSESRGGRSGGRFRDRRGGRRNRVCPFCADKVRTIDYKNADLLRRFVNEEGKIRPRRQTNVCAKHQRGLAQAIKRARHLALLPYTGQHTMG